MGVNDGRVMASGGVATEKTSPKFEICGSVRFFGLRLPQWGQNRGSVRAIGDKLGLCDGQWGLNRGCVRASGG